MRPGSDALQFAPGEVERSRLPPDQPWGWRDPWSIPCDGYYEHGMAVPYNQWGEAGKPAMEPRERRARGVFLAREDAQRIDAARLALWWTWADVARVSGINKSSLSPILDGERRVMAATRARLLEAVGLEA